MLQIKEQEKYPDKKLNEMYESNLSNMELKKKTIRMLKKLNDNYNSMKNDIGTTKKNQPEMKNTISEMNILEGINRGLDEAEN